MLSTKKVINSIPLLFVAKDSIEQAKERGTVFFFHGFTANKDVQKPDLEMFAKEGYLLIGVDNWGHGDRLHSDFENHFDPDGEYIEQRFIEAVEKTAIEVPALIDALIDQNLVNADKLGLIGISMGSFISYKVLVTETRISSAALFIGSPNWGNSSQSPHLFPECVFPAALLTIVAGKDQTVPPVEAKTFHHQLKPYYASSPERLKLMEYPMSDHMMEEADWFDAVSQAKQWFKRYL